MDLDLLLFVKWNRIDNLWLTIKLKWTKFVNISKSKSDSGTFCFRIQCYEKNFWDMFRLNGKFLENWHNSSVYGHRYSPLQCKCNASLKCLTLVQLSDVDATKIHSSRPLKLSQKIFFVFTQAKVPSNALRAHSTKHWINFPCGHVKPHNKLLTHKQP